MAEEKEERQEEESGEKKPEKKGKLKLIIVAVIAIVLLGGGGFFAYSMFLGRKAETKAVPIKGDTLNEEQPALFPLSPFVVNLADRGRFLKVTIKLEMTDIKYEELVKERTPRLRDTVITLLSSKTAESISTPEGKFQLKDELLMRANTAVGRDVFKNIYFTDFVMQ